MTEYFRYTNEDSDYIDFLNTNGFYIKDIKGLGTMQGEIQSVKAPFQTGSTYIDTTYNDRKIRFNVYLVADSRAALQTKIRDFLTTLHPEKSGVFRYSQSTGDYELDVRVEDVTEMSGAGMQKKSQQFSVVFTATDPRWRDTAKTSQTLNDLTGGLEFPFEYNVQFSTISGNQTVTNTGDLETGVELIANGPATDPKVWSYTTSSVIEFSGLTLQDNQYVVVDTRFGRKEVTWYRPSMTPVQKNAFGYLTAASYLWKLQTGDNELGYTTAGGSASAGQLEIKWYNRYIGV